MKINQFKKGEKMRNYKNLIGDGKLPNLYWVFHYDGKMRKVKNSDGSIRIEEIQENQKIDGECLGEFKTYKEAIQCINEKAYYPHAFIEDRLSGQVFESCCIVCECCGHETFEYFEDTRYTKKILEESGLRFE